MVSFANPEEGLNYQHPEPDYPAPEALKSESELKEGILNFVPENVRASFMRERHVEIRPIDPVNPFQPQPEAPLMRTISVPMTVFQNSWMTFHCIKQL